jgi:hypothetical protein
MLRQGSLRCVAQWLRGKQPGQFRFLLSDKLCQLGLGNVPLVRVHGHIADLPTFAQAVASAKNATSFWSEYVAQHIASLSGNHEQALNSAPTNQQDAADLDRGQLLAVDVSGRANAAS